MTRSAIKTAPERDESATPGSADALASEARAHLLMHANINPNTGLASDYLNHFNEAIMLLDMIPDLPECADDFLDWRPTTYREHFTASTFKARELAISAYDSADPAVRTEFDNITGTMTSILSAVGSAMREARHNSTRAILAHQASGWVKPLVTLAGAIINGAGDEADVDTIMKQSLP
jgi:hypothetical protein